MRNRSQLPAPRGDSASCRRRLQDLNPEQAAAIAPLADGVVIGSALVRLISEKGKSGDIIPAASAYASWIRRAIDAARPGQKSGE